MLSQMVSIYQWLHHSLKLVYHSLKQASHKSVFTLLSLENILFFIHLYNRLALKLAII